jgi:hypothetical protein
VLDFISTAHASCELDLHKIGPGVVLALPRVTQTLRAYDFFMGRAETESKEADWIAATRKTTAPEPFVDAEKAAESLSFRRRRVWERARQVKSRRILRARDNTGMAVSAF